MMRLEGKGVLQCNAAFIERAAHNRACDAGGASSTSLLGLGGVTLALILRRRRSARRA